MVENSKSGTIKTDGSEDKLTPVDYLMQKINGSGISVHLSKEQMREILDAGKNVQKMSVKYGTSQEIEKNNENTFSGYGAYVVSLNEENAKQLGIKIASRKYGGTFYINNQPLADFLQEKNFSSYWTKRLEQLKSNSIDDLTGEILKADTKGNSALEKEKSALTTLFSLDLIEFKREQTYLYSVEIPDNDNTNYLLYGNPIGIEHANKINEQLEKIGANWRVSRNDIGQDVYFDVLSKNVFNGSQKQASEFLQKLGYVGMEMDKSNYIVFNDKDMDINDRVQYMKDKDGEVYGFAYEGEIYCDEDLLNSNTLAHEYTHIWDRYVQNNNPELWQQGKNILKGTSLWQSVVEDKNYENLTTDDAILSECHSRIVGDMAGKILENIAKRDGGLTRDQVINWDKEVSEYISTELMTTLNIYPEIGTENYISDSVKAEYLKVFLQQPMKDLTNGVKIHQNNIGIDSIQKMEIGNNVNLFKTELYDYLSSGKCPENDRFIIGTTPIVMQSLGQDKTDVTIPVSVIKKAVDVHKLSYTQIVEAVQSFYDPVLIFDSDKSTTENRKEAELVLTDTFKENKPIAIAINTNSIIQSQENGSRKQIEVQDIRSIHDRTVIAKNGTDLIEKWTNEGLCKYIDDKKITDWSTTAGIYFPIGVLQSDNNNILYKSTLVKELGKEYQKNNHIQKMISQEHQLSTNINLHLPSHSWPEELKEVITNTSYQSMLDNRELQIKGKAGNEQAAVELVSKIVNKEVVSRLAEKYPDAIVVPVPSMETADKKPNAIPMAYAREYEKAGLKISIDIIEIDSAHHTGKNAFKRTVNRPHFDGEVIKEKEYIIVDDVFAMGGTISSLKNFIEDKGGRVVAVSTLTPGVENSKFLGITDETVTALKKIDQRRELLNAIQKLDIAENYEALTDPIGKYIVNNREKIINEERTRRAQNNSKYNDEQNQRNQSLSNSPASNQNNQINQILDKEIESVQENSGLSDAAIEADIKAEENQKADYIDEPEQNPTDDFPMFTLENDHFAYPQDIYNALEKFNSIEPEKWNLSVEDKVAVKRLIDVAEIKDGDKNKSIEKLNNYILSEEYKREESSYSKILTPVFEAYNNKDESFSYTFSVDKIKPEIEHEVQPVEITGKIKSILGNEFSGKNIEKTESFQKLLVKEGLAKPDEEFILVNELEAHANGTKVKENEPFVILNIPVNNGEETVFVPTKYYHISALEEPQKVDLVHDSKSKEIKKEDNILIYGKTKVPEFAMITQHGLEDYKNMVISSYEEKTNMYLLTSEDNKSVKISKDTLKELTSSEFKNKAAAFDEKTKKTDKLLESQYNDFFELRSNNANNFRHNLSVFCRKEANSPLDAITLASSLVSQMSKEEKRKTKDLLNLLRNEDQTINQVIVDTYYDAVKEVPLNEEYLKNRHYENMIARPMYDTISAKGEKIDRDLNLKIGDTVDVQFMVDKNAALKKFVIGNHNSHNTESINQSCTVISSSKEGNKITLMDGNKSFYDIPRDTFMKEYEDQQKNEKKQKTHEMRHQKSMQFECER